MFRPRKDQNHDQDASFSIDGEEVVAIVERSVNPYLVLFHDPSGFRAEQIRGLRNKMVAMNPDGASKTLVITSAIRGEGKSVAAINLAMAFAELERHSVVLVDGDMRRPAVERYLHLNPAPGLSDLLLGRVDLDEVLRDSSYRNLTIIGAGTPVSGPSEILSTPRIDDLYARLKERFQYVVIDTPPVLPATDAGVLGGRADGTMLVVRLEHSTKSHVKNALRDLEDLGANVLGTFVTEVRGADPEADRRLTYRKDQES